MRRPGIALADCIVCEIFVELATKAFTISDSGFAQARELDDYGDENIHEAVKNCPKDCITWEED